MTERTAAQRAQPPGPDVPVFVISVAAELTGLHPQTLRTYDRLGLVSPGRAGGGGRRYSWRDIELLREVAELTAAGIGLEGVRGSWSSRTTSPRCRHGCGSWRTSSPRRSTPSRSRWPTAVRPGTFPPYPRPAPRSRWSCGAGTVDRAGARSARDSGDIWVLPLASAHGSGVGCCAGRGATRNWERVVTVVLAEDDVDIRDLVQIVLEQLDLEVKAVGTGAEALEVGQREVPRLFLLDITMPGMNGLDVCRAIRADEKLQDVPVIFMTARAQASDVAAGIEAGADTYIIKPFGPIELREHVEALLDRGTQS